MNWFIYFLILFWCGWFVALAGPNVLLVALGLAFLLDSLNIIDRLRDLFTCFSDSEVRDCASKHDLPLDYRTCVDCDKCPTSKYLYCKKIFESQSFSSDQEGNNVL